MLCLLLLIFRLHVHLTVGYPLVKNKDQSFFHFQNNSVQKLMHPVIDVLLHCVSNHHHVWWSESAASYIVQTRPLHQLSCSSNISTVTRYSSKESENVCAKISYHRHNIRILFNNYFKLCIVMNSSARSIVLATNIYNVIPQILNGKSD